MMEFLALEKKPLLTLLENWFLLKQNSNDVLRCQNSHGFYHDTLVVKRFRGKDLTIVL